MKGGELITNPFDLKNLHLCSNKEKKDSPQKEENKAKPEKKPEENPENKNKLSEEELENLLLQVQEGEAHKQGKAQPKKNSGNKNLNPW